MDATLQVKRVQLNEYDMRYCIICEKKEVRGLVFNPNGRLKLKDAANIRKDVVWDRMQASSAEEHFNYSRKV